jgi:two-component system chemotaxis response regulator CheB
MEQPLRVLVVDDTVTYRKLARDVLASLSGVEVVGTAANGKIALERVEQHHPDLLLLDLEMPEVDGLEVLRRLKVAGGDVGAIMLSAVTDTKATMNALELGAFDFIVKPGGNSLEENVQRLRGELRSKLDAFARTRSIRRILHEPAETCARRLPEPTPPASDAAFAGERPHATMTAPAVVALGISTGGPQALTEMLPKLPASLPVPVLIVQHMPPVFTRSLAEDLNGRCALRVCEASDGQVVASGDVLIAPGGKQMRVERENGTVIVRITDDPPELSCKPSVDYLFRSVADVYGGNVVGVIMTGMGSDGVRGCRMLKQRGAAIIAQDQATCVVFGMPRGLVEQGIADVVAPLGDIAGEIVRLATRR